MGVMQLVEEGKLSLDEKVQDLVPHVEIKNPWHKTDPVRVKHLLEHTAGFGDIHFSEFYNTRDNPNISLEKALGINPNSRKVRWRPGTRYSYSKPGYAIAGYIIEKVTGQSTFSYQPLFWWPFAALCSIALLGASISQIKLLTIGEQTMAITYLFGISSIGALWISLRSWQKAIHPAIKIYFSIISTVLIGFALFFIYWDWMGLRLWAY